MAKSAIAQNIENKTIFLNSSSNENLSLHERYTYEARFILKPNQVELIQKYGNDIFKIESRTGTWSDISARGSITYKVNFDGVAGVVVFGRDAEGLFLTIDLSTTTAEGINQKFFISSFTIQ